MGDGRTGFVRGIRKREGGEERKEDLPRESKAKVVIRAPSHFFPVRTTIRHAVNIWTGVEIATY
jgi:hypothetical protein